MIILFLVKRIGESENEREVAENKSKFNLSLQCMIQKVSSTDLSRLTVEKEHESLPIKEELKWQLWFLIGISACAIAVLGENLTHIRHPNIWLMILFLISFFFTAGVRLMLNSIKIENKPR